MKRSKVEFATPATNWGHFSQNGFDVSVREISFQGKKVTIKSAAARLAGAAKSHVFFFVVARIHRPGCGGWGYPLWREFGGLDACLRGEAQSEFGVWRCFFLADGLMVDARFGSVCCEE